MPHTTSLLTPHISADSSPPQRLHPMCSHYPLLQNKPHQGSLANSNSSHLLCWGICHLDRAQQGWLMEEEGPFQGGSLAWLAYVDGLCLSAGAWRACGPGALLPLHMNLFKELLGILYSMAAESQEWVFQEAGRGNSQYHETWVWKLAQ